jgi:hypothetical protein
MEQVLISSLVNGTKSQVLKFQNPLLESISASILLTQESNVFNTMVSNRQMLAIGPLEFIDIPITFSPKEFQSATAQISIQINQDISWTWPIKGIPETELPIQPILIEGQARERFTKDFAVELTGLRFEGRLLISFESSTGACNYQEFLKVNITENKPGPIHNSVHFKVLISTNN